MGNHNRQSRRCCSYRHNPFIGILGGLLGGIVSGNSGNSGTTTNVVPMPDYDGGPNYDTSVMVPYTGSNTSGFDYSNYTLIPAFDEKRIKKQPPRECYDTAKKMMYSMTGGKAQKKACSNSLGHEEKMDVLANQLLKGNPVVIYYGDISGANGYNPAHAVTAVGIKKDASPP